jgi:hypothetical protein
MINHRLSYQQQEAATQCRLMARYYVGRAIHYRLAGRNDKASEMWVHAKSCAEGSRKFEQEGA